MENLITRRISLRGNAIQKLRAVFPLTGEAQVVRLPSVTVTSLGFTATLLLTLAVAAYLFFGNTLTAALQDTEADVWLRSAVLLLLFVVLAGLVRLVIDFRSKGVLRP